MKLLFDTCVLFPTVMREVLMAACRVGGHRPYWSERILGEWARASEKLGPLGRVQAESEIALLNAAWPQAIVTYPPELEKRLYLPDAADQHVLAAAVVCSADLIVTVNAKDFPRHILREEGLDRMDPDYFVCQVFDEYPGEMHNAVDEILATAITMGGVDLTLRQLMKKARLPKLGKRLSV